MGYYADLSFDLYLGGWDPLPILPGAKACLIDNWAGRTIDSETVEQWCKTYPDYGVGFRTGFVRVADIDILDPDLSRDMSVFLQERCPNPLVRVGKAPKTQLIYRVAQGSPLLGKRWSKKYRSPDGEEHRIEILGNGQQFVGFHDHPDTGKPYDWIGRSPKDISPSELPVLDEDAVDDLIQAFESQCDSRGWEVTGVAGRGMDMDPGWDEDAQWLVSYRRPLEMTLDDIRSVVKSADLTAREDWLHAGFGIHHETGGSDLGLALWQEASYDSAHDDCARVWSSMGRSPNDRLGPPATLRGLKAEKEEAEQLARATTGRLQPLPENLLQPGTIAARPYRYGHYLIQNTVTLINGLGGSSKSVLGLTMAVGLTIGKDLTGLVTSPLKPRRVAVINNEDDADEMHRRIAAICLHHGITDPEFQDLVRPNLMVVPRGIDRIFLASATDGKVSKAPGFDALVQELTEFGAEVNVFDPFVSLHDANENSPGEMEGVMALLRELTHRTASATALIHHSRKGTGDNADAAARGSTAVPNAARSNFLLTRMTEKEAERLKIADSERPRFIRVDEGKQNYALPAGEAQWFYLSSQPVEMYDVEEERVVAQDIGVPGPAIDHLPSKEELEQWDAEEKEVVRKMKEERTATQAKADAIVILQTLKASPRSKSAMKEDPEFVLQVPVRRQREAWDLIEGQGLTEAKTVGKARPQCLTEAGQVWLEKALWGSEKDGN